jgi:hypothetical protein
MDLIRASLHSVKEIMGRRITGVRKIPKAREISVTTCWNRVIPKKRPRNRLRKKKKGFYGL